MNAVEVHRKPRRSNWLWEDASQQGIGSAREGGNVGATAHIHRTTGERSTCNQSINLSIDQAERALLAFTESTLPLWSALACCTSLHLRQAVVPVLRVYEGVRRVHAVSVSRPPEKV